uniref:Drebrin n=1 Tax=Mola mola TaxID=94237 RepID=A0A3Q3XEJ5_MOLML
MAVNLGKNRLVLLTAYQDVIDETSDTDALYGYEDESNDLTLASSGGGLVEITLTFDSSRVMYGFCSLKDPAAALPRYILINWVGEDVPDARKCACASHVATVAEFFQLQGVEVIINASSLDDIDPSAIGQRLTNGVASVASPVLSRLRTREEENADGTVYEKTNAEVEMKRINREEFWEQAKRKKLQEEEEAKERLRNQSAIEPSLEDLNLDKKESEVEEAKAIIAQRSGNPREFFKQKERAMTISVDTSPVSVHRTSAPMQEQTPPVQELTPTKPVQSVAPQARDSCDAPAWESEKDNLVDLWDSRSGPPPDPPQTSNLVDLMDDVPHDDVQPSAAATSCESQPLLSFDEMTDGTLCSGQEDEHTSLVDMTASDQMTLSYQHALQHASGEELEEGQLLMTNGETLLKEGTQLQASEGYFSQSQEEEFGQSEESSAKPAPVFYNKPPEIDITCWDADPVV